MERGNANNSNNSANIDPRATEMPLTLDPSGRDLDYTPRAAPGAMMSTSILTSHVIHLLSVFFNRTADTAIF